MIGRVLLPIAILVFVPLQAIAQASDIRFTAVVEQTGGDSDTVVPGDEFSGTFLFSYDPSAYVAGTIPGWSGSYRYYEYPPGGGYGMTLALPSGDVVTTTLAIEVFDNGGSGFPSDTITFSTKQDAIFYSLSLTGPNDSFDSLALPSPSLLQNFWTDARFVMWQGVYPIATASVTQVMVSPVPEPSTWALMLAGLLPVLLLQRRRQARASVRAASY